MRNERKRDLTCLCMGNSVPNIWAIVYPPFTGADAERRDCGNQIEPAWRKESAIGEC
jgi:hypothetical protein